MTGSDERKIITVADPAALAETAAERLIARIARNDARIAICLTGGSSPKALYQLLATDACRRRIAWDRVHWFIGDERLVPPDDPLHNMSMARRAFLNQCAPVANVHPIATDTADLNDPDKSAALYEHELKIFYGAGRLDPARPLFDLVLMGIGPDGHTASLFPGYPAIEETAHWAVGVPKANVEPFVPRVTLTLRALASCSEMLFEISGPAKRAILTRLLAGENLPANRARSQGETVWLVDQAALPEDFRG
ncbi:6-phosphogluconolactonase [Bradyrhizobium lablabi]|uniref:6-phosphogluconolactonase n=1 Tax=Bradyrhizobium lablabi TaxID=722472 RepID=UPI001BA8CA22|nr:6-phosphogluconolactonase [Bradyrhizobium lablabi]MBR0697617.1 6-phosphogluconolactonase [Bradyrhizobium lablabi]